MKLLSPLDDCIIIYSSPSISSNVVPVLSVNCHMYCVGVGLASNVHVNVASLFSQTVTSDGPVAIAAGTIGETV